MQKHNLTSFILRSFVMKKFICASIIFFLMSPVFSDELKGDKLESHIKQLIEERHAGSTYDEWEKLLTPFYSEIVNLPNRNKDFLREKIADSIQNGTANHSLYELLDPSKIFYLVYEQIAPFFGDKVRPITTIVFERNDGEMTPVILGTHPIKPLTFLMDQKLPKNPYGFYVYKLMSIVVPESADPQTIFANRKIEWEMNNKKFTAEMDLETIDKNAIFGKPLALDYKGLWKDKVFTTLIFSGTNLNDDGAESIIQEYVYNFHNRGYVFEEPVKIENAKEYLKTAIIEGDLDLIIHEAHAAGVATIMGQPNREVEVLVGTKKNADGTIEQIKILRPFFNIPTNGQLITAEEFGVWVKERSQKFDGAPIVLIDGRCNSYFRAVTQLATASNKELTILSSHGVVYGFRNSSTDGMNLLLNGILAKDNFSEIRKRLMNDPEYYNGTGNVFLMPDEERYQKHVLGPLNTPAQAKNLKIIDSEGNVFTEIVFGEK